MQVHMTEAMFEALRDNQYRWSEVAHLWRLAAPRFDPLDGDEISYKFENGLWFGDSTSNMILASSWIKEQGFDYQVLWDDACHDEDGFLPIGWVITTNYQTAASVARTARLASSRV